MVQKRRHKKSTKFRGSKTHGYGSMKKHRGAGHRAGRGNAGSGKRSDAKKPSLWQTNVSGKDPNKVGFFSWRRTYNVTINVGHLSSVADTLVAQGKAQLSQGIYTIDLRALGISKLLGAGKVGRKLKVSVPIIAPGAKRKIEAAGGSVDAETVVDKEAVKAQREENAKAMREKNKKTPPQMGAPEKKEKKAKVDKAQDAAE